MTLDGLLFCLRLRNDILISEHEIWWSSHGPNRSMQRALRRHKRGVRVLLAWSSIATCPAPGLHRPEWYYKGDGTFVCSVCERIKVA